MNALRTGFILLLLPAVTAPAAEAPPSPASTRRTATTTTSLPSATLVSLKFDQTPAADAFQQLFETVDLPAGNLLHPMFVRQMNDIPVTIDLAGQPFMLALLNLCRESGLEPAFTPMPEQPISFSLRRSRRSSATRISATTRATTLRTSWDPNSPARPSWIDGPTAVGGPMVFVAGGATRTSDADLEGTGEIKQTLVFSLMALRDPKVRLYGVANRLVVDEAIDETGRSLRTEPAADDEQTQPRPRAEADRYQLPLTAPLAYTETSRTLRKLRAHLNASFVTRNEPIEIIRDGAAAADADGGFEKRAGEIRFTVGKLEQTGDGARLPLVLQFRPTGDVFAEVRALVNRKDFRVVEPDGAPYRIEVNMHSAHQDRIEGWVHFRPIAALPIAAHPFPAGPFPAGRLPARPIPARPIPAGPIPAGARAAPNAPAAPPPPKVPARVIWDVPVEILDVSIPVEFKDLPLP